jgi:hypothetical protein
MRYVLALQQLAISLRSRSDDTIDANEADVSATSVACSAASVNCGFDQPGERPYHVI